MFKKFNLLLEKKYRKYSIFLMFFWILYSLLEIIGISSVPILLSIILEDTTIFDIFFLNDLKLIVASMPKKEVLSNFSLFLIIFFLIKNLFTAFLINFEVLIYKRITTNVKSRIYNHFLNKPYSEYLNLNSSTIIRIVTEDASLAIGYLISYLTIISQMILLIFSLFLLLYWNFSITLSILIAFSSLFFIIYKTSSNKIYKIGKLKQEYTKKILEIVTNSISNIKEVIVYQKQNFLTTIFYNDQNKTQSQILKISLYKKIPRLIYEFLGLTIIVTVIFFYLITGNSIDEAIVFISLLTITILRVLPSMNLLTQSFSNIKSSEYSFNLILEILKKDLERNIVIKDVKNEILDFNEFIEFKNIFFSYPETKNRSIKNFNLKIEKNTILGVVGKSGSGKSTFVNLLSGLLKPTSGEINIDNKAIVGKEYLIQKKIGYIPQDNYMIDDTILKNIVFSNTSENVDIKKIEEVLDQSQLTEFVNKLKDGLNSNVGEKGVKISGGQRQRIGIARALYNEPEILIFDESFNSLDKITEERLLSEIYKIKNKTIIIVSHKLETLYNCKKVILIKNGEIIETGKPLDIERSFIN